ELASLASFPCSSGNLSQMWKEPFFPRWAKQLFVHAHHLIECLRVQVVLNEMERNAIMDQSCNDCVAKLMSPKSPHSARGITNIPFTRDTIEPIQEGSLRERKTFGVGEEKVCRAALLIPHSLLLFPNHCCFSIRKK